MNIEHRMLNEKQRTEEGNGVNKKAQRDSRQMSEVSGQEGQTNCVEGEVLC